MDGLTIGDLAQLAGVHVETVRYYQRRGLLAQPEHAHPRRYTEASLQRLALIRRAKELGFTLAEIGELLDAAGGPSADDILAAAHAKLADVEIELRELAARRCRLSHLVRACAAGDDTCVTLLADPATLATTDH
jgi:MerR family mercuric resistance operon transcriptional regulator